jgi:hypothetical protein
VLSGTGASLFLGTVKRAFNLQSVVDMNIADQAFDGKDTLLYLSFVRDVAIEGKELKEASGVVVQLGGNLTLRFDSKGELLSYDLEDLLQDGINEEKAGIVGLIRSNAIYFAKPGEKIEVPKLIRQRQRFYIQVDNEGKKRLYKAYAT